MSSNDKAISLITKIISLFEHNMVYFLIMKFKLSSKENVLCDL